MAMRIIIVHPCTLLWICALLVANVLSFTTTTTTTTLKMARMGAKERSSSSFLLRLQSSKESNNDQLWSGHDDVDDANDPTTMMVTMCDPASSTSTTTTTSPSISFTIGMMMMSLALVNIIPGMAEAAGPDWGVLEGRTASLLHPVAMFSLLAYSVTTAILGFQWRRQRTMGDEIATLKAQLSSIITTATETDTTTTTTATTTTIPKSAEVLSLEAKINDLQNERKELAKANPRDKHFSQGALLAFIGTVFAIEGPLNTYARAGKLFPGPHLYAGAGLVVCWALAAACVPAMQKGNDTARLVHISANIGGLGLFTWQVISGVPILLKVIELTKWP